MVGPPGIHRLKVFGIMATPMVDVAKNERRCAQNERDECEEKLDSHGASSSNIESGSSVMGGMPRKLNVAAWNHPMPSRHHVVYCFDLLLAHFHNLSEPTPNFHLDYVCPMFVTWNKVLPKGEKRLRGCIGTIKPRPICFLRDYCHSSAFMDRRFSPIELMELPELQCSVSFLVRYEKAKVGYVFVCISTCDALIVIYCKSNRVCRPHIVLYGLGSGTAWHHNRLFSGPK